MTGSVHRTRTLGAALAVAAWLGAGLGAHPARAARTMTWTASPADLIRGESEGVAITSRGGLFLAPKLTPFGQGTFPGRAAQVWSAISDSSGNVFLGTGPDGRIVKLAPSGAASLFFTVEEPMVTALALAPGGDLLAGTAPAGKIYRIHPDGKGAVWCETRERYVWCLDAAPDGSVFAGTGDQGIVFKIDRSGKAERFFDSDDVHIVSLTRLPDGNLLAGGAGRGLVYRLDGEGHARVVHDDELPEVRSVVMLKDGSTVAAILGQPEAEPRPPAVRIQVAGGAEVGTAPESVAELQERPGGVLQGVIEGLPQAGEERAKRTRGRVIRIDPRGAVTELWRSATEAPFCLALDADGRPLFGTGEPARLYRVGENDEVALLATLPEGQITQLSGHGASVMAATSNPAAIYKLESGTRESGTYTSRPFDAGTIARWGRIRWSLTGQAHVEFFSRTGNTAEPDTTWSAWSPALTSPEGSRIENGAGRFVQWQARLSGAEAARARVSPATVSFVPYNRAPAIRDFRLDAPRPAVAARATFRFGTSDPDGDPVNVSIQYRSPGEGAWSVAARAEPSQGASASSGEEEIEWKEGKTVWDTAAVPEGFYEVRAVAGDAEANYPGEGRETVAEAVLRIAVDRTPPTLDVRRTGDAGLEIKASDATSGVSRLEALREGHVLFQARPDSGVCDSREEVFHLSALEIGSGTGAVQTLRAVDAAGNVSETPVPAR